MNRLRPQGVLMWMLVGLSMCIAQAQGSSNLRGRENAVLNTALAIPSSSADAYQVACGCKIGGWVFPRFKLEAWG